MRRNACQLSDATRKRCSFVPGNCGKSRDAATPNGKGKHGDFLKKDTIRRFSVTTGNFGTCKYPQTRCRSRAHSDSLTSFFEGNPSLRIRQPKRRARKAPGRISDLRKSTLNRTNERPLSAIPQHTPHTPPQHQTSQWPALPPPSRAPSPPSRRPRSRCASRRANAREPVARKLAFSQIHNETRFVARRDDVGAFPARATAVSRADATRRGSCDLDDVARALAASRGDRRG